MQPYAESILVVEDDPRVRPIVADALRSSARVVHGVATAREALAVADDGVVDLIVLDIGLPDADGVALCRALRERTMAPVIVLSARTLEADKIELLNAGADDYVTKPFGVAELVARVHAQLRRARLYPTAGPSELQLGGLLIDLERRTASRDGAAIHLTPVEWSLLRVLAARPGRTFTHRQLFHAAWGKTFGDAQLHLRVHITHLRRKIERNPTDPEFIITEPGVGYRCELPENAIGPSQPPGHHDR